MKINVKALNNWMIDNGISAAVLAEMASRKGHQINPETVKRIVAMKTTRPYIGTIKIISEATGIPMKTLVIRKAA